jgi:hypothetical protein
VLEHLPIPVQPRKEQVLSESTVFLFKKSDDIFSALNK